MKTVQKWGAQLKTRLIRRAVLALAALGASWAHGELKLDGDFNRRLVPSGFGAAISNLRVLGHDGSPLDASTYTVAYSGNDAYGRATVTVTMTEGADAGTILEKTFDVVPVPAAYQPLEWVDLESQQYVRTTIVPSNDMDIDIRLANLDPYGGDNGQQTICCQSWVWRSGYLFAFNGISGGTTRNHFYVNANVSPWNKWLGNYAAGCEYHINLNHATAMATLEDSLGRTDMIEGYVPGASPSGGLNLFCDPNGGKRMTCRLYHLTFFENGTPRLDLVPVRRLSDGKVGLLDAAHPDADSAFYASEGEDFLPGPGVRTIFVEPVGDQTFTGSAVTPAVTVYKWVGGSKVEFAREAYEVTYENNVGLGTATATVVAKGDYPLLADPVTFRIVPPENETRISFGGDFGDKISYPGVPVTVDGLEVLGSDGKPLADGTYEVGYVSNDSRGQATVWARITSGPDAGAFNCRSFEIKTLPAGFRIIDWIESTGTQWINTGVQSTMTLVTECTITPNGNWVSPQYAVFGNKWATAAYFVAMADSKWRALSRGKYVDVADVVPDQPSHLVYSTSGMSVNGDYKAIGGTADNAVAVVRIFETGDKPSLRGRFRLHSFKMTDGGVVLRDFVPVLNAQGKPGLFDLAHDEDGVNAFYANANSSGDDFGHSAVPEARFSVPAIPAQTVVKGKVMPVERIVDAETGTALDLKDFVIVYDNNDKPGTAMFFVLGKEGTPYAGQSVVGQFKIDNILVAEAGSLGTEGTGYTWDSPLSFKRALSLAGRAAEGAEVWVKAGTWQPSAAPEVSAAGPVVIRGGFAGTEASPGERPAGLFTTIDGQGAFTCLTCANASSVKIDRLRLTRGLEHGLMKSGAGDLALADCEIENCGLTTAADSSGLAMYLSGAANVCVSNCLIAGCVDTDSIAGDHHGAVAIASGMKRVVMDDCRFLTNGVPFDVTDRTTTDGRGVAIWAQSPVTLRGCEFRGNRGIDCKFGCGIVFLYRGSGGSALTNCLFVGNNGLKCASGGEVNIITRGCLVVRQNGGERTEVVNCTFAYNLVAGLKTPGGSSPAAGINVISGDTAVKNCIFFGNAVHTTFPEGQTVDMTCHNPSPTASLTVSYTLAHDLYPGEGNMTGDPRFVSTPGDFLALVNTDSPALPRMDMDIRSGFRFRPEKLPEVLALDVHVQSPGGYYKNDGVFYRDASKKSPAVDAGDPSDGYRKEPRPNGRRVNLGAYGNTSEASRSPATGTVVILY